MARRRMNANIPNPLSVAERQLLMDLAKYAKDNDLLEGPDRKRLFQAGRFDNWFATNFALLPENLSDLIPEIVEGEESFTLAELVSMREKIMQTADAYGVGRDGGLTSKTDMVLLEEEYKKGGLGPAKKLELAELYEALGRTKKALDVARELLKEFPHNENVSDLMDRCQSAGA